MSIIRNNIIKVQERIRRACDLCRRNPDEITLIAVTKEHDASAVREAFDCGLRHFGENRVQEAEAKLPLLADIRSECTWHMIGHLQSNKALKAVELFDIVHSVDSLKIGGILHRYTRKRLPILLEVNMSYEKTKSGIAPSKLPAYASILTPFPKLDVQGLMTIAPMGCEEKELRSIFHNLRVLRDALRLNHLSMGMSDDFETAIEEGATMLRIGRAIFGERS